MNESLISILKDIIPPVVTALVAWFLARKKNRAEVSGSELENVEKALSIYRSMVHDLRDKIKELEDYVDELERIIEEYKLKKN